MTLRKLLRSLQVFVPFLQDARFQFERHRQRASRRLLEPDFAALGLFSWDLEPLFLDIGANRGLATEAMRLVVSEARVVAFEPNPVLFRQLKRLFTDVDAVTCYPLGLGETALDTTLWVPVYRNWVFDGLGSLDPDEAYGWLKEDRLYFFDERHLRLNEHPCSIRRLDDLDLSPAFIKIDVQGHELDVLRGAEKTLTCCRPLLMVEDANRNEIINFLRKFKYTIANFDGTQINLNIAGSVNSFFLADEHVAQVHKRATSA